jgi:signal transduction histidine kinase
MKSATELLFPGEGELATLMRQTRWEQTPLGAIETWPNGLRAAVRIMLTSRFSMWMAWGDELAFLYNDAYRRDTLGAKHPRALGMATKELWSEIWSEIGPRIGSVLANGHSTWDEDLLLILERNGYREETYHTFSYSPLYDDDDHIRGVLCVVSEETARLISERRVALLGRLGTEIGGSNTDEAILAGLERSIDNNTPDLPFTMTYLFDAAGASARLVSKTGFSANHRAPPAVLAVDDDSPWRLSAVAETGHTIEVALAPEGWPWGAWQAPPTRAFVVPLAQQGQARPAGVFICGLNPYLLFEAPYREFVTLFAGQLAAGLANARAYEQERKRAESLAELDRAKTVFFSNVSHELRTPLTLMIGPLNDLLADPDVPPVVRDELATVHRNSVRLLKLVNTMLDFSRIEAGRAVARFRPVDLAQLTADLASVFRAATEKAGLGLVVDCPPLTVLPEVDHDMWEKIVLNLVSNAFKFTLEGEIAVSLGQRGANVELVVRDTGCGIPTAELPRIFDRFHRVEGTRGRTHEGTGIGLALVHELVRIHGGSISVASEQGRGTAFTVSIPIRATTALLAAEVSPGGASARREPDAFAAEAMRWLPDGPEAAATVPARPARERLIVVDDNADMRAYIHRLLSDRWDVQAVGNGQDALVAMKARRPDLVITDVMMPVLDGPGLVAAIRADRDLAGVPILMLSARAGEEARIEGLEAGANDYLVKPFASRELRARVESMLLAAAVRSAEEAHARRLVAIFEQAPVALAIVRGPDHVFEVANPPSRALVGARELVGRAMVDALPEIISQGFIGLLDRVYQTGEAFRASSIPIQLADEHGVMEPRLFDLIYQPIFDTDEQVTGITIIGHDVTALGAARREAETANRAKDEFLAMLGHELRNPLAPIMTALQLMRADPDLGAKRERAVIERQVQHLAGLVDDLLDVSRITQGKIELRSEHVEIAEVIARSIELTSPLFEQHHHGLALEVPRGLFVRGDRARLAQIFSNLLTNAAKYTPSGGHILVRAEREPEHVVVTVIDDGIGIEAGMLERIFEPFAQARQSIERAQGGLGLGLAIVDNLVRLHRGTATASSPGPGRGSEFTVCLPALDLPDAVTLPANVPRVVQACDARVLIVDDNVDAAQMLADLLDIAGYDTLAAHDGPSALDAAEAFRPQVAVLDLGLPIMDGFELARHLRAHPALATTKLVALTGYGQAEDRAKTAAAGFAAHFVKPVDNDALCATIQKLLSAEP